MHELVQTFISKIVDETVGTRFNLAKAAPTGYNAMMASKATFSNAGNRRSTGRTREVAGFPDERVCRVSGNAPEEFARVRSRLGCPAGLA